MAATPITPFLDRGSRRRLLLHAAGGFGAVALTRLLAAADEKPGSHDGLHHRPRARRVIQLFMNGGASPVDTFDFKPALDRLHGQKFDPGDRVESVTGSPGFKALRSPFEFRRHGACGRWVSSVFPHMARHVDDLAFLTSMASKTNVHGPASYMQCTGFTLPGFPCMGAWISYAIGSETENLPHFVVLPDHRGLPYNNRGNFSGAFLPARHQGTVLRLDRPEPIADLRPPASARFITPRSEADGLRALETLNRIHLRERAGDSRLEARIDSYELAAKMQLSAPEALDISQENAATRHLYGLDNEVTARFGESCLTARRLCERGVRFVQLWSGASGASNNWDNHTDVGKELPAIAASVDRPIAGLLEDLKQRGLLDETLVIWTTEFGRMPFSQNKGGRDHNQGTFVTWLAGAGIRGGVAHGRSDEWAWKAIDPIWSYDLHATVLHLLGVDHERLAVRHNGIDRRLTDVHGHVIREILA